MEESTITDDPILPDDAGAEEALPAGQTEEPAATQPPEPTSTSEEAGDEEPSLPEPDDKLKSFAKGQGIEDVSELSPREQKLLKIAYDNNAEFQRNRQKASQLEKSLSAPEQPVEDESIVTALAAQVQNLTMAQNVQSFWADNPDAKAYEQQMADIVTTRPDIGQMVKSGYLTINDLYNLARGADPSALKAAGGKEALEKVAKKQQAKAIPGSATTSEFSKPEAEDPFIKAFEAA